MTNKIKKAKVQETPEEAAERREKKIAKTKPFGSGSANSRLLRILCTPRQDRLLKELREQHGNSESEHVRRAIDMYLDLMVERGELKDEAYEKLLIERQIKAMELIEKSKNAKE